MKQRVIPLSSFCVVLRKREVYTEAVLFNVVPSLSHLIFLRYAFFLSLER